MHSLMLEQGDTSNDTTRTSAPLGGGRAPRRAPGRPRKQVDATLVEELAKIMASRAEIAAIARCSVSTLDRHFDAAIKRGNLHAKGSLRRRQFEIAMAGNVTMLIWLGKQYLGQVEKQEVAGKDGGPVAQSNVHFFLPDNGRDITLEAAVRDAAPDFLPALEAEPRSGRARLAPGHASSRAVSDELKATHRAAAGRSSAYELL